MSRPPPHSYLLRLWRERPGTSVRATLIAVGQPDARQHFDTLDALFTFLRAQAGEGPCAAGERDTAYCTPSESG